MNEIRQGRPEDAPKLPDIERSAGQAFRQLTDLAWLADGDPQSVQRHLELIAQGTTWVAEDGDTTLGFLSGERFGASLHIWELSVRSEAQKQGVGRQLIETAQRWSAKQGLADITLTTFRSVPWNELFYRSCGFRTLGRTQVPPRLAGLLENERKAGLPVESRCAMVWES